MTNNEIISSWQEYFISNNIEEDIQQKYIAYIKNLINSEVPIILDLDHLSLLLGIFKSEVKKMVNSPESFYRIFEIPKRSGGQRMISMPYPTLLYIQRWIKTEILDKVKLNDSSHGFVKKKSILTNAKVHIGNTVLLKMDISDFFPTINIKRVISIFQRFGYSHEVSFYLSSLCTFNNQLPQGAATSPTISNIIAKKFDIRLNKLAKSFNLSYSRYADDLTFSGKYIPHKIISIIKSILIDEGFIINDSKTKLISGRGQKIITGISINSNELKLPKTKKRQLRQEGYYLAKYPEKFAKRFSDDPFYIDRIIGKYNFWLQIEPNNNFAKNTIIKLKSISNSLENFL